MRNIPAFLGILVLVVMVGLPSVAATTHVIANSGQLAYVPDEHWISTTPEEQEMSSQVLDDLIGFIDESYTRVDGLVITRNGYIVKEQYWGTYHENRSHHIFSCTKSFTSALVGIAIKEGFIDNISQRMVDFFPEYTIDNPSEMKSSITIEHLLTMTHGLDWNEHNNSYTDPTNLYMQMFYGSSDPIQYFLDLPALYTPGEHWVYTTGASHMLSAIVQRATGMTTKEFAEQYLFGPMNEEIAIWTSFDGVYSGGTQLYITPRAMNKLGLLYLNNGTWGAHEILSADYVSSSREPYLNLWEGTSYGYQWWVAEDESGFMALGSEMQMIYVHPDSNMVIAITGSVTGDLQDVSSDIIARALSAVTAYTPNQSAIDATQILMMVGIVSVIVIPAGAAIYFLRKH